MLLDECVDVWDGFGFGAEFVGFGTAGLGLIDSKKECADLVTGSAF